MQADDKRRRGPAAMRDGLRETVNLNDNGPSKLLKRSIRMMRMVHLNKDGPSQRNIQPRTQADDHWSRGPAAMRDALRQEAQPQTPHGTT